MSAETKFSIMKRQRTHFESSGVQKVPRLSGGRVAPTIGVVVESLEVPRQSGRCDGLKITPAAGVAETIEVLRHSTAASIEGGSICDSGSPGQRIIQSAK